MKGDRERRTNIKIAALGGGPRDRPLLERLVELGFKVTTLGDPPFPLRGIQVTTSLGSLLKGASILLLPASGVDATGRIKEPFCREVMIDDTFLASVEKNTILFVGHGERGLKQKTKEHSIPLVEFLHVDTVATLNAIPTAEGAIMIALQELPTTLSGTSAIILGLGRIGLSLGWRLKALNVTVLGANRSKKGLFKGVDLGLTVIPLQEIEPFLRDVRLLFNTIPAPVFGYSELKQLRKDTILIDLASAPGGIDFHAAESLDLKASLYPGIPGRFFPEMAGRILAQTLPPIMEREVKKNTGGVVDEVEG